METWWKWNIGFPLWPNRQKCLENKYAPITCNCDKCGAICFVVHFAHVRKKMCQPNYFKQFCDVCWYSTWFITINQANAVSFMDKLRNGKMTREQSDHYSWLCLCLVLTWRPRLSLCADLKSHSLHLYCIPSCSNSLCCLMILLCFEMKLHFSQW